MQTMYNESTGGRSFSRPHDLPMHAACLFMIDSPSFPRQTHLKFNRSKPISNGYLQVNGQTMAEEPAGEVQAEGESLEQMLDDGLNEILSSHQPCATPAAGGVQDTGEIFRRFHPYSSTKVKRYQKQIGYILSGRLG